MLYIILILGVAMAGAVKNCDKPERVIDTLLRTPHNEFFNIPKNSSEKSEYWNEMVYNGTSRFVEEIHFMHRDGIAQAISRSLELLGNGVGLVITTGGITYDELIGLSNVLLTQFFHSVEDPLVQAAGNLLLRSGAVGHKKVIEKIEKYLINSKNGEVKFPKPCNISDEEFELISIAGATLQISHELFPSNPSPGLKGEINEKLCTFGNFEGYSIFPNCGRESYDDYEKIFLTENPDHKARRRMIRQIIQERLVKAFH